MRSTFRSLAVLAALLLAPVLALAQGSLPLEFINAQTGTTYAFANTDCTKLVTFSNSASVAATIAAAGGSGNFQQGCWIAVENKGVGLVTITPTTSTINGATSITVLQNQSVKIISDGTNYQVEAQSLGGGSFSAFRNYIDNGGMFQVQRTAATTAATGAINGAACTSVTYFADRWCVDTNVAVGAGFGQVITATPSPLTGFTNSLKVFRNSAALTQPVCAVQEISSQKMTQLQGQTVVLSFYAQALAGLSADNGNVINATFVTGTTADQGLGTWTASPAITPAFSGLATQLSAVPFTITTSWARYNTASFVIPAAALEGAVEICFTPTATGAGATDGFALVGVQLEAGTTPSAFEFRDFATELAEMQRYFWQIADAAATVRFGMCQSTTTAIGVCVIPMPVTMRVVPAVAVLTATSFGITIPAGTAATCTTLASISTSSSANAAALSCTTGGTLVQGDAAEFIGGASGATNTVTFSADF